MHNTAIAMASAGQSEQPEKPWCHRYFFDRSYYDTEPLKRTLAELIDFGLLNGGTPKLSGGTLADKALSEPLTITKNGRDHFVRVAAAEFEPLKRRDRKVNGPGEVPDEILDLIAKAEVPLIPQPAENSSLGALDT